jgi:hypothetical protein
VNVAVAEGTPATPARPNPVQASGSDFDNAAGAAAMQSDLYPHMRQAGVHPLIQNVVAMFNLGTKLSLKHIGLQAKNAEVFFSPSTHSSLNVHSQTLFLLFSTIPSDLRQ